MYLTDLLKNRTLNNSIFLPDAKDLVRKFREALECDHVSKHIHEWIDLIFGYKQRGIEAEKADNGEYKTRLKRKLP